MRTNATNGDAPSILAASSRLHRNRVKESLDNPNRKRQFKPYVDDDHEESFIVAWDELTHAHIHLVERQQHGQQGDAGKRQQQDEERTAPAEAVAGQSIGGQSGQHRRNQGRQGGIDQGVRQILSEQAPRHGPTEEGSRAGTDQQNAVVAIQREATLQRVKRRVFRVTWQQDGRLAANVLWLLYREQHCTDNREKDRDTDCDQGEVVQQGAQAFFPACRDCPGVHTTTSASLATGL